MRTTMNWTTKGVAALATGITLFCGMGTVTAVALTSHHGTAPAAAAAPARTATPPAAVTPPAPKATVPAPAPTKTIIVQAPPAPAAAQPASALRYVGNGIYAGANTSDAFAQAVVSAWSGTPGVAYVYSPVTGQTYAMTYQVVGAGTVIATGGNGAYVQF
jgi:hypothetical protein